MMAIVCLVGYTLLSIYLGNGLINLPYNLIYQWWQRPKKMTSSEISTMKNKMRRRIKDLLEISKDLKSRQV